MDNLELSAAAAAPPGLWTESTAGGRMTAWLEQRHRLVGELTRETRAGFQAVAAFRPEDYLDSVERQEALAQRLAAHDRSVPEPDSDAAQRRAAAAELRLMNTELRKLNQIQAALIEQGGRSVRCFQRVWAMAAPETGSYAVPTPGPQGRQ